MSQIRKNEIIIMDKGGEQLWTTSLDLAKNFGKRHDNLVRDIKRLECSESFRLLNFEEIFCQDSQGRDQFAYNLTRDGFTLLAMGFTGKKAIAWKEKYIAAFNAMERKILKDSRAAARQAKLEYQQARDEDKIERRELTDSIKRLKELADEQNPANNAERYYITFTKMVVSALFNLRKDIKNIRDELPATALRKLQNVESIVAAWINEEVDKNPDYHQPYKTIKERLQRLIDLIGQIDLSVPA